MADKLTGSCLCGGVAFEIERAASPIGQCHCSKCRKVSGTDGNAVFYADVADYKMTKGEELIKSYVVPGSTGWTANFCSVCGSPMPHSDHDGSKYFVPAGLLDSDFGQAGYAAHIFVESKADWVSIADAAPQFPEGFDSEPVLQK